MALSEEEKRVRREYYYRNKEAQQKRTKLYREKNREILKEKKKQYYEQNKEAISKQYKEKYHNVKEKKIEYSRQYYSKNKDSINEKDKQKYQENKEIFAKRRKIYNDKHKDHNMLHRFGVNYDIFLEMLNKQNNLCIICKIVFSENIRPCIDHDHNTNKIRGLLCHTCNFLLGHARDNPIYIFKSVWWILSTPLNIRFTRTLKKYKSTRHLYEKIQRMQNNSCGICEVPFEDLGKSYVHVDHDHSTGFVRGLLCRHCNLMIGHSRENKKILLNAMSYLLDHK